MPKAKRRHIFVIPKNGIFRGKKVISEVSYQGYRKAKEIQSPNLVLIKLLGKKEKPFYITRERFNSVYQNKNIEILNNN